MPATPRYPLPTPRETQLLQALLLDAEPARSAWRAWRRQVPDPLALLREGATDRHRALLPLLAVAIEEGRLTEVEPSLRTVAHTALLREERRRERSMEICAAALTALEARGLDVLTVGGAPMAERFWRRPESRHSGGPRWVLGREAERKPLAEACSALVPLGFDHPAAGDPGQIPADGAMRLSHESGLTVIVSTRFVDLPLWPPIEPRLGGAVGEWGAEGVRWRGPGPAHALFELLVDACLVSGRSSMLWVADVLELLRREPAPDWGEAARAVESTNLALPFAAMLDSLREGFQAAIPEEVTARLRAHRARPTRAAAESTLLWSREAGRSAAEALVRCAPGPLERWRAAWWVAMPSRRFLREAYGASSWWQALCTYGGRPLRWLAARSSPRSDAPSNARSTRRPAAGSGTTPRAGSGPASPPYNQPP